MMDENELEEEEDFVMWELPGQRKTLYDPCFYQNLFGNTT